MLESLMLVLLGALLMGLVALALAPLLWARAARLTADRLHDEAHSTAFSRASQDVSRRYEEKLTARETALRAEIGELEASRDKISGEASARINDLEEARTRLEHELEVTRDRLTGEIAARDRRLTQARASLAALAAEARQLAARADALDQEQEDGPAEENEANPGENTPSGEAEAGPADPAEPPPETLSDRIRALRDSVPA